ncbi:MAG: NAD(P)-binding protein [Woeseiaceae bacterium]|jgi:spermidine dehydrogenase|nr:NAD(P)-binding protein [Woeseiaceae bacterium]
MIRKTSINRRDFVNGCALSLAAGTSISPLDAIAQDLLDPAALPPDYYPPTLQGMRGSHDGSFEVAHAVRDGATFNAVDAGDPVYDLVVVGGGLSGLSAAYFFRKQHGPDSRILILDNHDDFGGHAKRNEFRHAGNTYLVNGGTLNVEAPSQYSTVAAGLLWELGIDRERYFEKNAGMWSNYGDMGLKGSMFYDEETFGEDKLVVGYGELPIGDFIRQAPVSPEVQLDAVRLYEEKKDYLPGLNAAEKRQTLTKMSYRDFVVNIVGCHPDVMHLFDTTQLGIFVTAMDAIPAIYCREMGYPGFDGMGLEDLSPNQLVNEPGGQHGRENTARAQSGDPDMYFPDGNATLTRLLVSRLVPDAVSASTMEDIVLADIDYGLLDRNDNKVRIRLNSTVIDVAHVNDSLVETSYVLGGNAYSVSSRNVVMACWNSVIPHICGEVPPAQREALAYGQKSPLVYTGVLVSNWQPWVDAGISRVSAPGGYHPSIGLQPMLEMGDYRTARSPDEPIVVRMSTYFYEPGHSRREQHRIGRNRMLTTPFETFEHHIRDQLQRILGPTGFDEATDILGITVNRWPHGYTYSYNPLFDPASWAFTTTAERPCVIGRQRIGRIAIANADASASPHTDGAINEAYRAVNELLST